MKTNKCIVYANDIMHCQSIFQVELCVPGQTEHICDTSVDICFRFAGDIYNMGLTRIVADAERHLSEYGDASTCCSVSLSDIQRGRPRRQLLKNL